MCTPVVSHEDPGLRGGAHSTQSQVFLGRCPRAETPAGEEGSPKNVLPPAISVAMRILSQDICHMRLPSAVHPERCQRTVNPQTETLDFRGLGSSILLKLRGAIPRRIGNSPEI